MKIPYTVHTVSTEKHPTEVVHGSTKITADVEMLVVELVSDDETQKNPMLVIPPAEATAARKLFQPGAKIVATFTAAKGKSE